jgi:hypothetical protein
MSSGGSFVVCIAAGPWRWPLTPIVSRSRMVELYLHCRIRFHSVVLS